MTTKNTSLNTKDKIAIYYCMNCGKLTIQINRNNTSYKCTRCQIPQ